MQKAPSQPEIANQPEEIKEEEYDEPAQADQTAAPETMPAVEEKSAEGQAEEVYAEEPKDEPAAEAAPKAEPAAEPAPVESPEAEAAPDEAPEEEEKIDLTGRDPSSLTEKEIQFVCRQAFREIDRDNSGYIDIKEVGEWLKGINFGESPSKDVLMDAMAKLDTNGDGVLDDTEFSTFFRKTIGCV